MWSEKRGGLVSEPTNAADCVCVGIEVALITSNVN